MTKIGNLIRDLRKEKNITIEKLSKETDVDLNYLENVEKGIINITSKNDLKKILNVLTNKSIYK